MTTRNLLTLLMTAFFLLGLAAIGPAARAHDVPTTYGSVRLGASRAAVDLKVAWVGITHELPDLASAKTATPEFVSKNEETIARLITDRFGIATPENPLTAEVKEVVPTADGASVEFILHFPYKDRAGNEVPPPKSVKIYCDLFPLSPNHRALLGIYQGDRLEREAVMNAQNTITEHTLGEPQGAGQVFVEFVKQGIHHIFIGPDHILFIIGLLLAGGTLVQLLKVVTGFTLAHSITLAIATLGWFSPPSRLVEATIALSIVFVGVWTLRRKQDAPDRRLWFAFGFGLIHGFGFASVLQELDLPRYALGTSLFAFNIGVELGQACIVLLVAPILALILKKNASVHERIVQLGAFGVTVAGAVWFIQRVLPA
jgi:hypothetical protein